MGNAHTKNKIAGVVLLEAVVSVVILAVSMTVLIESLTAAYKATVINATYIQALNLLENQMSLLTRTPFLESELSPSRRFPPPNDNFEYTEEAAQSPLDPSGQLQDLKISLKWKTGSKENKISMTTSLLKSPDGKL